VDGEFPFKETSVSEFGLDDLPTKPQEIIDHRCIGRRLHFMPFAIASALNSIDSFAIIPKLAIIHNQGRTYAEDTNHLYDRTGDRILRDVA
jgi:hypothetical protein